MKLVMSIWGVFIKSQDPKKLQAWYEEHLGIEPDAHGSVVFKWREKDDPEQVGYTVWAPFKQDTKYFDPSTAPFMVNFRVADLYGLLEQLRAEGVTVADETEEHEYGKFGWIMDPDGNRVELWEPPEPS